LPHALLGIFLADHRQILAILRDIRFGKKRLFFRSVGAESWG
jgi:hypothetical protein